jgi:hypothetical protein
MAQKKGTNPTTHKKREKVLNKIGKISTLFPKLASRKKYNTKFIPKPSPLLQLYSITNPYTNSIKWSSLWSPFSPVHQTRRNFGDGRTYRPKHRPVRRRQATPLFPDNLSCGSASDCPTVNPTAPTRTGRGPARTSRFKNRVWSHETFV